MTLDRRARRAAQGIHRAVEVMEMSTQTQGPGTVERFDGFRDRKQRSRRIGALALASGLVVAAIVIAWSQSVDRGQGAVPADQGSVLPAPTAEVADLGTITQTDSACSLELAVAPRVPGPGEPQDLTLVNASDEVVSFDLFWFDPEVLPYERFEARIERERQRALAGRPFLGPPRGATLIGQTELSPGRSESITEYFAGGSTYAVVCLHAFDEVTEDPYRPFAVAGPIAFE